ncbi:Lrp/AsnC family transcriptional regulator [Methylomonas methanica]|jgi:DNA-binding Lrp family transcriptional regulator|uniref:siroheme decarboxylase n=1 Tax=Methylomonas methanica TaxID=421 RepID=A0A177M1H2_METMH|nr:Lrp/AsnC family transcriptional regulator [Methylomonas methanica]OAH99214.1 AsnC family transcriptional regulator [Methylomonas methanica]OAI01390.1 AsnC family transcriptional regulator [Methylomonas methanica]
MLAPLHKRLLNDYQQDFPLSPTPYRDIAEQLGVSEDEVLNAFQTLSEQQMISRIGPVIAPNSIGNSALVAMAVPDTDLARVAELVSAYPEVNHNYERENRFNLWFVLIADSEPHLKAVIADIETQTGYPAMLLPMLADYFINLGFELNLHD